MPITCCSFLTALQLQLSILVLKLYPGIYYWIINTAWLYHIQAFLYESCFNWIPCQKMLSWYLIRLKSWVGLDILIVLWVSRDTKRTRLWTEEWTKKKDLNKNNLGIKILFIKKMVSYFVYLLYNFIDATVMLKIMHKLSIWNRKKILLFKKSLEENG